MNVVQILRRFLVKPFSHFVNWINPSRTFSYILAEIFCKSRKIRYLHKWSEKQQVKPDQNTAIETILFAAVKSRKHLVES